MTHWHCTLTTGKLGDKLQHGCVNSMWRTAFKLVQRAEWHLIRWKMSDNMDSDWHERYQSRRKSQLCSWTCFRSYIFGDQWLFADKWLTGEWLTSSWTAAEQLSDSCTAERSLLTRSWLLAFWLKHKSGELGWDSYIFRRLYVDI